MGTQARARPTHLAEKLLTIRKQLGLSQGEIAERIGLDKKKGSGRISEYEAGSREPNLILILNYARLAKVCTCVLIDDAADLTSKSHRQPRK